MPEVDEEGFRYKYFRILGGASAKRVSEGPACVKFPNFPHFLDAVNKHLRFSDQQLGNVKL
jgi:hypothetical protein